MIVVLLGMGGSGKTQLALELCQQEGENLGFMAVLWIDASSPHSVILIQSYKVIAQKISNEGGNIDIDSKNTVSFIQDTVQNWKHRWLIVFDNYDTPNAFQDQDIRFYIPSGQNGHVLFTSRHANSERLGQCIRVDTMSEDESLNLLLQRSPNEEENIEGRRIASTLGYLALALDQAGAYIRARRLPLKDFISHYNKRKEIVLREVPEQWEYRKNTTDAERETLLSVFTTWELSFEQVRGDEVERRNKDHFLTLAAFFDNNKISERYFQAHYNKRSPEWMSTFSMCGQWETCKFGDILAEFQSLSLLQLSVKQINEFQFSIHPVVRDWIRLRKNHDVQQQFAAEAIIALAQYLKKTDHFSLLDLESKQEISLHIDACIQHEKALVEVLANSSPGYDPDPAIEFASVYNMQGRHDEAEKLFKRALTRYEEQLGFQHKRTLGVMRALSSNYRFQGQHDKAAELCERVLIEHEEQLGPQHLTTLHTMHDLARTYRRQRRYDEAEKLSKCVLISFEKKLGPHHAGTLNAMCTQAKIHRHQRRYDEAQKLCERALADIEQHLGPQDLDTLITIQILAQIYDNQRRYDEAAKLYERALAGFEEKLGSQHPNTLIARNLVSLNRKRRSEDNRRGKEKNGGK